MKFSEFARGFLRYKAGKGKFTPATGASYDLSFHQFMAHLSTLKMDDDIRSFTGDAVDSFCQALEAGGCKASSVLTKLSALSSLGMYGMKVKDGRGRYLLEENPVSRVERPQRKKPKAKYLYAQELRQLLTTDQATPEQRLIIRMLIYAQLRASALVNAKVRDLSIDGDIVRLSVLEKGDNPDNFPLPKEIGDALLEWLKIREARPEDPLLVNSHGQAYTRTSLSSMIARVAKRAGITRIPVRAHVLARHSAGSIAGKSVDEGGLGLGAFEIAAMLRHRDTNTVQKYVHGVTARSAREKFWALLENA